MPTPADKRLDTAREHLRETIKALSEIVVHQTDGTDEFTEAFRSKLRRSMDTLIQVRDEIS